MNMKRKLGLKAGLAVLLDVLAIAVIGYIAMQTMNLLLWTLLLILGLVFSYDAFHALTFIMDLLERR